jgi:sugar phosphate isomerase/epimerase
VIGNVTRRNLLAYSACLLGAVGLQAEKRQTAKTHITKSRVSAITDEMGRTQEDAVAFAKQFPLQWVDLRNVPGSNQEFGGLSEPELKRYAAELAANKLKVSLLRTSLLKFSWGADDKRWDRRKQDFARAVAAAEVLGVDKIRIFTGTRTANPAAVYSNIVQTMEEMIPRAEDAKVRLLIENDPSQNIGTCAELKAILDLLPSKAIGFNWDPWNALALNETPWPTGYAQLPKSRMLNVQIRSEGLSTVPRQINWRAMLDAMQRDGYQGEISVATQTSGDKFEKTDDSIREVLHIVGELS